MSAVNDATLVRQCLEGDNRSFEILIDRYQKAIFNVAFRMTNNAADAEDITQSVFVKAFEKLDTFNFKSKFFSWIYRMAVNEALNFCSRERRYQELDFDSVSEDKTPAEHYEEHETCEQVASALMALPFEQRAIIVLKHFHNLSYQEIGYIIEIPEKTVKSRLFAARRRLRDILIEQGFVH